jgi:two-component system sensor histidine kinase KdpD
MKENSREKNRPNPDELIKKIKQDESENSKDNKGKLKIFLGYCAGVGKTYKMLQEAALNRKKGIDVVVGIVETHNRKETVELLAGLEIIQRRKIDYSGIALDELDVDAVFARKPELVIIDELAHTNIPGSRHEKRFQDVEELLNAGIDVFTTLNIQHIESLNDIVQQVSGVKVAERVPDSIIEIGEIELVDLIPEKLLERLKEGKVYIPEKAEQAMHQFFRKGNLLALRELSLKYTAKQVDEDVQEFMKKNVVPGPWQAGSKLLVAISASSTSERLLRFSYRLAADIDVEWFAVYVDSKQG